MGFYQTNLPGTYEFFSLNEAQSAADNDMLRSGTIVMVDGKAYKALYYDEEKRTVLVGGPTYTLQDVVNTKRK